MAFDNNIVIYNEKYNDSVLLFGSTQLSGCSTYSIEILSMRKFVNIGVIDHSLRKSENQMNPNGNIILYRNDKIYCDGR